MDTALILKPDDFEKILARIDESVKKTIAQIHIIEKPLNKKMAAKHLDISEPTLDRWVKQRLVPGHKKSGKPYFFAAELNESIKNKRQK